MEKVLFIVRGLPGSGKTTLAHIIANGVCSADDYFTDSEGNYNFDPSKLKAAHADCRSRVEQHMSYGEPLVAVANTFTQEWEMEAYFNLAEEYGYMVQSIVVENRHGGQNIHNVPAEAMNKMRDRFEVELG